MSCGWVRAYESRGPRVQQGIHPSQPVTHYWHLHQKTTHPRHSEVAPRQHKPPNNLVNKINKRGRKTNSHRPCRSINKSPVPEPATGRLKVESRTYVASQRCRTIIESSARDNASCWACVLYKRKQWDNLCAFRQKNHLHDNRTGICKQCAVTEQCDWAWFLIKVRHETTGISCHGTELFRRLLWLDSALPSWSIDVASLRANHLFTARPLFAQLHAKQHKQCGQKTELAS